MTQIDMEEFNNWRGCASILRSALRMLRPPDNLRPSEWAERNLKIPEGNRIPGFYRVMNAPIQREPMDQFVNPECRRVTLMWGAQIGKTTCALGMQGFAIAQRPRSQMMMQPSQGDLKTWLETKFNPLTEASESIGRLIAKPRGREGVNNQGMKSYPGGFIMFAWAGSTKTMRGRSAPFIVCDEVDGYNTTDEGSPVSLIWQRAATFGDDRFLVEISTPTLKEASYIEQAFEAGDQRHFHVCCPDCGEMQILTWGRVSWAGRRSTELHDAAKDLHDEHDPATAAYCCEHCGTLWNDGQRVQALRSAEEQGAGWIATKPFKGHASYHAWEAYSTFRRLEDIVQDYLDKLKLDDLQSFANVSLSRTYEIKGDRCDPESLYAKREAWPDHCPDGVLYVTLGADMQMDRLEYEIVGWGMHGETWSLEYGVLWGDPLAGQVFFDLGQIIKTRRFTLRDGTELGISASCLDTGGTTGYPQAAYDWLKGKTGRRIFGVKGYSPSWGNPIVPGPQRRRSGRARRKVDIFPVAVDEAKVVIYRRISQTVGATTPGGPGYMHVPDTREEEWFNQLTAESLVTRKGNVNRREWVKSSKARNEALDCRVYAYAALQIMKPVLKAEAPQEAPSRPDQMEAPMGQREQKQGGQSVQEVTPPPKMKKRRVWRPPGR
ncbi:phage terminase large subunit family protein [Bombella pollinis]|uniref:Phage terminase large subunit family protein n=1 Tax=Bombella pollinis TaxID=2967337 RepID=A0ABT3WLJ9_9PROT|nr:terminase gpA endonuclease subunit [Bombella pollinis]MCX5619911.1 phage terminase large subunit family protein [Bombella pollinis]